MTKISYTTANALINSPHTWLNKINGLKTFSTRYFEEGKELHRIVQDSLSGKIPHPQLGKMPEFDLVEEEDFDQRLHVERKISGNYIYHGYVDGISTKRKEFIDIKTGRPWGVAKFSKHPQFSLYAWALGEKYKTKWLLSLPRNQNLWNNRTIKIFTASVNDRDYNRAEKFLEKAIDVIENISNHVGQDCQTISEKGRRSPFCYYVDCPVCSIYDTYTLG